MIEPTDFEMPSDGLNVRWPDPWYLLDDRIELRRLPLAVRIDLDIAGIEDKVAARAVYGR